MVNFLDLKEQYLSIKEEIDKAIFDVIDESAFIGGKYVKIFEENFKEYLNAKYVIGVGNGTDALEIALWGLNLPKDSEVIVPANSFIASSEAISRNNLKVIFADVGSDYLIDTKSIEKLISDKTSAIVVVHLYGQPCDMDEIEKIAKKYNLKIIEDSAQAHGATYKDRKVGTLGDVSTFSFYPGKNLGAYGDGGAIVTNSEELAHKCRMYANHGRSQKYNHEFEGRNSRLDGLQASILNVKLKYLDKWIEHRNRVANFYFKNLKDSHFILPKVYKDRYSAFHLFVIRSKKRDELKEFLATKDIQSGIHYPITLPKLQAYSYLKEDYSNYFACKIDDELLSLPIGEHLSDENLKEVLKALREFEKLYL